MLIDSHCHLEFEHFDKDRAQVIHRAQAEGIGFFINVGSSLKISKRSVDLAKEYDCIYASCGIHPHYASFVKDEDLDQIRQLAQEDKVVAIGEVGLDYYDRTTPDNDIDKDLKKVQRDLLGRFIRMAYQSDLPVIFHCRNACDDLIKVISLEGNNNLRGVVHCFSHDKDFLYRCLDLGLFVSFTANITYKKADNLRELIRFVPLDRLLIETDSPYLTPQAFRGRRNAPAYIKEVAKEIARIKNLDLEHIAAATAKNTRMLFDF